MANRPANAGPGSVGLGRGLAPMGEVAPPPGAGASRRPGSPPPFEHDAASRPSRNRTGGRERPAVGGVSWVPYLVVLAGAAAGMFIAWRGAKYAALGTAVLGASLLVAALGRLLLPARYAGLLATRRKAADVLTFAVLGAAVLAVALTLP